MFSEDAFDQLVTRHMERHMNELLRRALSDAQHLMNVHNYWIHVETLENLGFVRMQFGPIHTDGTHEIHIGDWTYYKHQGEILVRRAQLCG